MRAPGTRRAGAASPTSPPDTGAKADLERSTGAVNFITAADFGKGRASTVRDMLDHQPGVFIQSRTGQEEARLSIRGSGIQRTFHGRGVLVTQDGLPLNLADGSFDMQNLDPAAYSRILVWRGAGAAGEGSGTLGGAIDFVSFTGATHRRRNSPRKAARPATVASREPRRPQDCILNPVTSWRRRPSRMRTAGGTPRNPNHSA